MSSHDEGTAAPKPLYTEWVFLVVLAVFVAVIAVIYAGWTWYDGTHPEPVGSTGLTLVFGLCMMSGLYLRRLARQIAARPEDDPDAEIDSADPDYGHFSPWSWWPLVCGIAVTLMFAGPAFHQWWVLGIGAVVGIIGVAGHVTEYNRGPHGH